MPRAWRLPALMAVNNVHHLSGASERLLTVAELAAHLSMSERWIRYRLREGMPCQRFGRSVIRFKVSEVDVWLRGRYGDAA